MKLYGKTLVALISDGVEQQEIDAMRARFEGEGALLFVSSPQEHLSIETVQEGRRGGDVLIDLPFEVIATMDIHGLVLPAGQLSVKSLLRHQSVSELIRNCHAAAIPIIASSDTIALLYEAGVMESTVLVRDQASMETFLEQAVQLVAEHPLRP